MLKKLMSGIVIGSMVLSMVGCTSNQQSEDSKDAITYVTEFIERNCKKQEQQVQPKKEEVKKEQPKEQPKEEVKKNTTKKEQNDNIDPETGLAKVKHGKHLQEEADKQEEDDSIWTKDYCPECGKPLNKCICNGDCDPDIVYPDEDNNNLQTPIYDDYQEPDEFKGEEDGEPECPDCGQPLSKCDYNGNHTTVE